jgi:hypothetical protein
VWSRHGDQITYATRPSTRGGWRYIGQQGAARQGVSVASTTTSPTNRREDWMRRLQLLLLAVLACALVAVPAAQAARRNGRDDWACWLLSGRSLSATLDPHVA